MMSDRQDPHRSRQWRAAVHAALGDPARLAIVDELKVSDRSPKELGALLDLASNRLAHHLDVLERAGLVVRLGSAGDGRRKYVRLQWAVLRGLGVGGHRPRGELLFLCRHNAARSQLAAAVWTHRTGRPASSAGTRPAARVHRGARAAARRAGLSLAGAVPRAIGTIPVDAQVVTVCDVVHEELEPQHHWWHWSIPDPVEAGDDGAFDAVIHELDARIAAVFPAGAAGDDEQDGCA